jgi:hypothetical protein
VILLIISIVSYNKRKNFIEIMKNNEKLANARFFETGFSVFAISENGNIGIIPDLFKSFYKIINIKDINGFDIDVNGNLQHNTSGAIVGGFLFGFAGAIVGGQNKEMISKLSFIFKINDFNNPTIEFPLILQKVKKGSFDHQKALDMAKEISVLLEIIEKKYKEKEGSE